MFNFGHRVGVFIGEVCTCVCGRGGGGERGTGMESGWAMLVLPVIFITPG